MGTRFLATVESSASDAYKQAVVDADKDDIHVSQAPGSPCGMPFVVVKTSPMFQSALKQKRKPRCDKGYVLFKDQDGNLTRCAAPA